MKSKAKKTTTTEPLCGEVMRVQVHPSIVIGGVSVGSCPNARLPGLVVCYDHATKDSLAALARAERRVSLEKTLRINDLKYALTRVLAIADSAYMTEIIEEALRNE